MNVKKSLKKKGAKLVYEQKVEPIEINPKQVIDNIDALNDNINKVHNEISQLTQQLEDRKSKLPDLQERLKLFEEHREWALGIQNSKAKALFEEVKDEVIERVKDGYEKDPMIQDDSARIEMMHQFRHYVTTHPKISGELSQSVIKQHFHSKDSLISKDDNPFSDYEFE